MFRLLSLGSLRAKFIFISLTLVFVPMAGIGLYGHFFTSHSLSQYARERSIHEVHLQAKRIVDALEHTRGDVVYLNDLRSLRIFRSLKASNAPQSQLDTWQDEVGQDLLLLQSVRPMYHRIRYIDAQGKENISVETDGKRSRIVPENELQNRQNKDYFSRTMVLAPGDIYISSFDVDRESSLATQTDVPVIRYATNLEDDGLIVIDLHLEWVLRDLFFEGGEHSWAIINQDGRYLLYPEDNSLISASFSPDGSPVFAIPPDAGRLLEEEVGYFETDSKVLVFDTIHLPANSPDRFWVIFHAIPKNVLYADLTEFYETASVFLLGMLVVTLGVALISGEQVLAPVLDLKRKVEAFGRGLPVPPLPKHLPADEIGQLTRAFYNMAQELEKTRREERRLIEQLITAQEEERKLIAYDLHDGLIQQMVGARFHLTNCRARCLEGTGDDESLSRTCDTLTDAIVEGRRIIQGLHPTVLDDLGLIAALQEMAQSMADTAGWDLRLSFQDLPYEPEKSVSVTLFRIAQEALNNARKHAHAGVVSMQLMNGEGISLTVHDDGSGFNADGLTSGERGMGITTMHERAHLLNGTCAIASAPEEGTTITVWVPWNHERMPK